MPASFRVALAADTLRSGGVVAHPTEGVWGLACLPVFDAAIARIIRLKQRDPRKGLILVGADAAMFDTVLARLPEAKRAEVTADWPGPVTWIMPDSDWAPSLVRGEHASVALRVTAHPLTAALSRAVGMPLVSTSANPAGRRAATNALQVRRYFGEAIDYILDGQLGGRRGPSELRDARSGARLR